MRKIASVFVALLMLLSVISIAFAQDTNTVTADATVTDAGTGDTATETDTDVVETTTAETQTEATPTDTLVVTDTSATEAPSTEASDEVATAEDVSDAGITPDQPIRWGIERAIERIDLALTFNKAAKAKKGLAYARERLMEVKTMIADKKLDAAEKAKVEHGKALGKVKQDAEAIDGDLNPEEQLQEQVDIEKEIDEQEKETSDLKEKIEKRTRIQFTDEQKAKIEALTAELSKDLGDARVKIEIKKNKVKIAIQAKTGKSAEEVKKLEQDIRDKREKSVERLKATEEKAREAMQKAEEKTSEVEVPEKASESMAKAQEEPEKQIEIKEEPKSD